MNPINSSRPHYGLKQNTDGDTGLLLMIASAPLVANTTEDVQECTSISTYTSQSIPLYHSPGLLSDQNFSKKANIGDIK